MKSWHLLTLYVATTLARTIVPRDGECDANPQFSCPRGTNCMPITNDNTTVICCPSGGACTAIQPISCKIQQQNATTYPQNLLHSTRLDVELEECGSKCCPSGYKCESGMCVLTKENPPPTPSTSSASPTITRPPPTADVDDAGPSPAAPPPPAQQNSSSTNKVAIAVGVTLGILAAAIMALIFLWLVKRSRRNNAEYEAAAREKSQRRHQSDDFMGTTPQAFNHHNDEAAMSPAGVALGRSGVSGHKPQHSMTASTVSEPMWNNNYNDGGPPHRTDFLLGRRGSVETGFEGKMRPSWSKRGNKNRPKFSPRLGRFSRRSGASDAPSEDLPTQHPTQLPPASRPQARPKSRLNPLFATPLRFGLPSNPKPVRRDAFPNGSTPTPPPPGPPIRPSRPDEHIARAVEIEGTPIPSGAAMPVFVENNTHPAHRHELQQYQRDRSESQRRSLIRDDSTSRRHSNSLSSTNMSASTAETPKSGLGIPPAPPIVPIPIKSFMPDRERGRTGAPAPPPLHSHAQAQAQAPMTRMSSTTSTATFESGCSSDLMDATLAEQQKHKELGIGMSLSSTMANGRRPSCAGARTPRHGANASSETINVLLPPPSVFQTPPPVARTTTTTGLTGGGGSSGGGQGNAAENGNGNENWVGQMMREREDVVMGPGGVRRETTFEELMKQAGWRKSEFERGGGGGGKADGRNGR